MDKFHTKVWLTRLLVYFRKLSYRLGYNGGCENCCRVTPSLIFLWFVSYFSLQVLETSFMTRDESEIYRYTYSKLILLDYASLRHTYN